MKEIEIKAHLRNKKSVMDQLRVLGCVFSDPIKQEDVVYVQKVGSLETFLSNKIYLRIRVNNGSKTIFNLKEDIGALVAIEHEVEVSSKTEMENILSIIGYQAAVGVNKIRVKTKYKGCEICVDDVEELGAFIEMEKMSEEGDALKIQEELFQFFESLGIKRDERVTKGYDILMLEKA